ncbi:hypothetical protein EG346_22755 [Chryseobacterium carnipullorum]|uniref:Uncharacterized protein n=1 Tax=Chryseobacterium carnipullorum TaxID=1124835 RepID=A0A376E4X6_CHRCU|nr:hypothetical protein [Chryseobacterium carnipullorum]AZA50821.1 hypothetical protein EG346_22755 [Chryseobacterium carnipullorum]AZA65684.1 hypothetical protein EG345_13855 [Chryseobacterium carnipullorum]STD02331.1 Uncharacterised protein [Chryseobacterium carnipullorum]
MKNSQKKDALMIKFQNSRIERTKLDSINGGKLIRTGRSDVQTGLTSDGNHDNNTTPSDDYYNGTL